MIKTAIWIWVIWGYLLVMMPLATQMASDPQARSQLADMVAYAAMP